MPLVAATAATAPNPTSRPPAGDPPADITRDRWGRPLITPPGGGKAVAYTRASTLGGVLEDQYGLGQWRMRQVALGIGRRRDLQIAAAAAQPEDKRRLGEIAESAMEAAESSAAATVGTALHSLTELVDTGRPLPDVGEHAATLEAYRAVMDRFTVHGIETFTVCDQWSAAGTFDRLVSPRGPLAAPDGTTYGPGDRLILDLKTSSTADYFGIKFAVQLAIYAHGLPYDVDRAERSPWPVATGGPGPDRRWALILHAPSGGETADLWWVDLELGAQLTDLACSVRDWRKRKDLVRPAGLPELDDPEPFAPTLLELIVTAPDEATLNALWEAYRGTWADEHTAAVRVRLAQLEAVPA